jgi:plasmid stabilization system protein ParE
VRRIVILPAARRDIIEIGDFIALDNPARALAFVAEIEARTHPSAKPKAATRAPSQVASHPHTPGRRRHKPN